jgi:hypothetical protein
MSFFGLVLECCSVVGPKAPVRFAFSLVRFTSSHRQQSISRISLIACYRMVVEMEQDAGSCMESDVLEKLWKES